MFEGLKKWMGTTKGKLNVEGSWVEALPHYLSKPARR